MARSLTGKYRDRLSDGRGRRSYSPGWRRNRIVSRSGELLAALMKGDPAMQGILYLALGQGDPAWDEASPQTSPETQQLQHERLRHPLADGEIVFLDEQDQVSPVPTSRLEISVDFVGQDVVTTGFLSLREFGLFGGDAGAAADSGYLINYVIHPRIDLTPNATLTRKLRLDFNSAPASQTTMLSSTVMMQELPAAQPQKTVVPKSPLATATTNWLAEVPVTFIDGVGTAYAAALTGAGIATIGELAGAEIDTPGPIPPMKFMELRAKAQLALQAIAQLSPPETMLAMKFKAVFAEPVSALAAKLNLSKAQIGPSWNQLGMLQLALDQRFLENKRLAELIAGTKQ